MIAVLCIYAKLVYDFEFILTPIPDINEGVLQGGIIIALESVDFSQAFCGSKHIRSDDTISQACKLRIA